MLRLIIAAALVSIVSGFDAISDGTLDLLISQVRSALRPTMHHDGPRS
jgi:hypothetical protein